MIIRNLVVIVIISAIYGCGIYTFNGSSLPSDLKTVDIPLFMNKSMEPNVADEITQEINTQVQSGNLLRIVTRGGDASISGTVTSYENKPYMYSSIGERNVDIDQYKVTITADVEFTNNKKNDELFKGEVTGEGIYNFKTETEADGRKKAEKELVKRIIEKSVQSW